jgi:hypothetical protein
VSRAAGATMTSAVAPPLFTSCNRRDIHIYGQDLLI